MLLCQFDGPDWGEMELTFMTVIAGGPASGYLSHMPSMTTIISGPHNSARTVFQHGIAKQLVSDTGIPSSRVWYLVLHALATQRTEGV